MQTMAQDYYKALEISRSASQDEIQKAYRKLARKYHPDMNPDDKAAQQKFKEVQKAYDCLNDPEKRKLYDQFGDQYENVASGRGAGGGPGAGGFGFEDIFGGAGQGGGGFQFDGDLGDLFRQFGGAAAGRAGGGRARPRSGPTRGGDLSAEITVPFNTAILGGQASITVQRSGKSENLQVKIPAGVETGKKIRLRGQGEPSPSGGQAGDLLITLNVANHPYFKRNGQNLELRLPVTLGEAALGATVDLPTPGGTVALKIPAGSSSGRRLRVKGQGVRDASGAVGDLYVELQIKVPENLDDESRKAIEHIEQLYTETPRIGIRW
jgi:DnaJ-class molecular chaperone